MDIIQDKVIITHKLHGQAPGDISYIHQIFPLKQKRTHYTVKEREREKAVPTPLLDNLPSGLCSLSKFVWHTNIKQGTN